MYVVEGVEEGGVVLWCGEEGEGVELWGEIGLACGLVVRWMGVWECVKGEAGTIQSPHKSHTTHNTAQPHTSTLDVSFAVVRAHIHDHVDRGKGIGRRSHRGV